MSGSARYVDDLLGCKRTVHTAERARSPIGLSMTVLSRAVSMQSTPLYQDGDTICGSIHVDVPKKRTITRITISVYGRHSCSEAHDSEFLHLSQDIWSANREVRRMNSGTYTRDLRGTNIWDFAIPLPVNCNRTDADDVPLPPSFGTRSLPEALFYEVCCTVRKGLFSEDEELVLPIRYQQRSIAGTAAVSLFRAYSSCTPLPGPEVDADAWMTTRHRLKGDFFSHRQVEIECEFSLAGHLRYARGDPLPFAVKIFCTDQQLVDLLAVSPNFIAVDLQRKIEFYTSGSTATEAIVGRGQSWITTKTSSSLQVSGEIPLSLTLQPSFQYRRLALLYFVQFRLHAPGLQLSSSPNVESPLSVDICALRAPGPRPVAYASSVTTIAEQLVTCSETHSLALGVVTGGESPVAFM